MKACCDNPQCQMVGIIHHFSCSEQNLEFRFRQGDTLVCPKCRTDLAVEIEGYHFDYPAKVIHCFNCKLTTSP